MTDKLTTPQTTWLIHESLSQEQLLDRLSADLFKTGYVTEGFSAAVKQRESKYPTGLPTHPIAIAIPHTDPEFVTRPGIAVAKLNAPVTFREMGSNDRYVEAAIIFVLCLPDGKSQLATLQKLMTAVSQPEKLARLDQALTEEQLFAELDEILYPDTRK